VAVALAMALAAAGAARVGSAAQRPIASLPEPLQQPAGPVVDHRNVERFLALTPERIAAAAALRVLFIDHSVGANISDGLDCMASASLASAPSRCTRFEHVRPELSADPAWFRFGVEYDRSRWVYAVGGGSYWRDWPATVESLIAGGGPWDVIIPMPSYLVAPNGGWAPIEPLEQAHPGVRFVYATSSLPRGAAGGTAADQTMAAFNVEARAYAVEHGKALLDVADILSHDYAGQPCFDTRDGAAYCQTPDRCENLPDDGLSIPAICQHYTSELYGGHLGSVSGGALRMAQAMWLLAALLADGGTEPVPTPSASAAPATPSSPTPPSWPSTTPTPTDPAAPTPGPDRTAICLPLVEL
jgi:hypothetical protein